MRRYFVTGGTGFVGRALVRELLTRDDTELVMCLTRGRSDLIMDRRVEYWKGDMCDVEFPRHYFTDVIHAAAEANDLLKPDQIAYYYSVVEGARRVFEWVKDMQPERVLFVSSGAVAKADSSYCRAKKVAEHLARELVPDAKVARVYSLVGEEMPLNGQYAIGKFFGSALKGAVRFYKSNASRTYLHVDDCAKWMMNIMDRGEGVYDVGSTDIISVESLAHRVGQVMGVPVIEEPAPPPHGSPGMYMPDVHRSFREMLHSQLISLTESLERVRDYLRNTNLESRAAS